MKKWWYAIALIAGSLAIAAADSLPSISGPVAANGTLTLPGLGAYSTCSIDVTGTWTGTLDVVGPGNAPILVRSYASDTSTSASITSNGLAYVACAGLSSLSVDGGAANTGTAQVTIAASQGIAKIGGGGGASTPLVGAEPITVSSSNPGSIGFDYTYAGTFNSIQTLGPTGTATSTTNYPSNIVQFSNSAWNGTAPVKNNWSLQEATNNNLTLSYNGTILVTFNPTMNPTLLAGTYESNGSAGGFFAFGSLVETNATNQTDNSPRSCTNIGPDGGIYIGTNLDGPTAWTIANINSGYTFGACYNNTSYGAPPITQGIVYSVQDRTGIGNYFLFDDTSFPVRYASAVNVGGYSSFSPTTGQLSADPGQSGVASVTTPASCASLAACGTGSVTFTTAMPNATYSCVFTTETYPFVAYITTKATTSVAFTLTTLAAISTATTVPVDYHCREQ